MKSKLLIVFLVAIECQSSFAQDSSPLTALPKGYYPEADADHLISNGDYAGAIEHLRMAVLSNPSDYNFFLLGYSYYQMDKYPEAVKFLSKSIELIEADYAESWIIEDRVLKFNDSYIQTDRSISLRYLYCDAFYYRADAKRVLSDYRGAIKDYQIYMDFNSTEPQAPYDAAYCYYQIQDMEGAVLMCTRAISINSEYSEAFYLRGVSQLSLGRKIPACDDLSRAGELGLVKVYEVIRQHCN